MNKYTILIAVLLTLLIFITNNFKCKNNNLTQKDTTEIEETDWKKLKQAEPIANFKNTEMIVNLNDNFNINNNILYATTSGYAWEGIINKYNGKAVQFDSGSVFKNLINSIFYQNTLERNEYFISINGTSSDGLIVNCKYHFDLEFNEPFHVFTEDLLFKNKNIKSFGTLGESDQIKVLYYNSNKECILQILSKKENHDIILALGFNNNNTLEKIIHKLEVKLTIASAEKKSGINNWKYTLNEKDIVQIPMIDFNLTGGVHGLSGKKFWVNKIPHSIIEWDKQIACKLTEKGMAIESADTAGFDSFVDPRIKKEKPKPKEIIFNQPFILLAKKSNQKYPYFMFKVEDAQLLIPFK